jgi:hypothetical protein
MNPYLALPGPRPMAAGHPAVLVQLKQHLGILPHRENSTVTLIGPDQFPLAPDSPLRTQHELLTRLFERVVGTAHYYNPHLRRLATGRALLAHDPAQLGLVLLAAAERHVHALLDADGGDHGSQARQARTTATRIAPTLLDEPHEVDRDGLFDLMLFVASCPFYAQAGLEPHVTDWLPRVEQEARRSPLTEGERYGLWLLRRAYVKQPLLGKLTDPLRRLTRQIGDGANFCLVPGEVWADEVNTEFTQWTPDMQNRWASLCAHALTASSSHPSAKWLQAALELAEAVGVVEVRQALERWLPLVPRGSTVPRLRGYYDEIRGVSEMMPAKNVTCLRGWLWLLPQLPNPDRLARHLTGVALSAYRKLPGIGPRAVKVGNAAVRALAFLGSHEAVGQLAVLKVRVKFGLAQKEIEKAFTTAAETLQLPRDQIEEIGIPTYGLQEGGWRVENMGSHRVELVVSGSETQLRCFDAKGKLLKSVPAAVKRDHAETWKEQKQDRKDIQGLLHAQRDRIDSMFLARPTWSYEIWRQRYLDHPLVGTIARRLLWCVDGSPALFLDGTARDVRGTPIPHGQTAEITLWHPVGQRVEAVLAWRQRLEDLPVTQPFKQAHRELYLLTDAERGTGTYSNRFAAHVIRQHQFNALCAARGWKNRLRLMVDDEFPPPSKELPEWGLRAEFWVESIGDTFGVDTNDSAVFLRLATDQVRFYRREAAVNRAHASGGGYRSDAAGPGSAHVDDPFPLEEVPPLVFSEIMRDIDLFVGVASVGNDPAWQDGGPEGRYRTYWEGYSFGELSGTAATRKQVLERLVPRLKIADRCSISDRFLIVRGTQRTYKIHLGSANILMEPNDQYLCIVPDARVRSSPHGLFLPFEGDHTLSIILSKAFLLADDAKITDPTITRQIEGY